MQERKRPEERPEEALVELPLKGDIQGPSHGDFTDWDNPEDEIETAPEDYYEDDEDDEEEYELSPDDPDYDLSEEAGYGYVGYEEKRSTGFPPWVILLASAALIMVLLLPLLLRFN